MVSQSELLMLEEAVREESGMLWSVPDIKATETPVTK